MIITVTYLQIQASGRLHGVGQMVNAVYDARNYLNS
jgi:hypothetical protein